MATIQSRAIKFFFQKKVTLTDRRRVRDTVIKILRDAHLKAEAINYIFCSDEDLWSLNLRYLKHDTYTDIVTFDLSEGSDRITADIYISVDRIRENAAIHKVPVKHEVLRVIFHGALHLCGIKDKSVKEQQLMRLKEEQYLGIYTRSTKHGFSGKH